MVDGAPSGADIHKTVLEATCDALGLALLICDRNDEIVYASRTILHFYPVPAEFLHPGARLRDFLGAIFDCGLPMGNASEKGRRRISRSDWISEQLSSHWRERFETVERVGRNRWFSIRRRRLTNGMGILALSDISEQRKREEQMQIDHERIEMTEGILDGLPNPVCVKDRSLTYIAVNKAFCAMHGRTPDSILGRTVWDLVEADLAETYEKSDRMTFETGQMFRLPELIVQADGDDLWVVTRKFLVGEPGRQLLVTMMNDVTDIVVGQLNDGPADLTIPSFDVFEPGQNCYDPFLAMDMHDLMGTRDITPPPVEVRHRVLLLAPASVRQENIISQLKRWGYDACAVHDCHELGAFRVAAAAAGMQVHALVVDGQDFTEPQIAALWPGTVCVGVDPSDPSELKKTLKSALGARHMTDNPLLSASMPEWDIVLPNTEDGPPPSGVEVVVAEDNAINQIVFSQILEGLGISHCIAADGQEAVRLWRQHRPRLVLMDLSLPVLNGFEAARAIREAEEAEHVAGTPRLEPTPIVAVITQALEVDIQRSRDSGMDDYVTKPISPDMIEAIYRKHVLSRKARLAG